MYKPNPPAPFPSCLQLRHKSCSSLLTPTLSSHRPGAWLPADHRVHREYLRRIASHADSHPKGRGNLTPALEELRELIEGNTRVYMYFNQMFEEIPQKKPYQHDPTGTKQIRDYEHMLEVLNQVVTKAPEWTDAAESVGMVGVPMNALFDYPMGTPR